MTVAEQEYFRTRVLGRQRFHHVVRAVNPYGWAVFLVGNVWRRQIYLRRMGLWEEAREAARNHRTAARCERRAARSGRPRTLRRVYAGEPVAGLIAHSERAHLALGALEYAWGPADREENHRTGEPELRFGFRTSDGGILRLVQSEGGCGFDVWSSPGADGALRVLERETAASGA